MPSTYTGARWRSGLPPGVYEQLPAPRPTPTEVRMDVAAFVGLTRRGPPCTAIPVESWDEFRAWFGAAGGERLLPEAVYLFFANGGRRCVVVRALHHGAARTARWHLPGLALAGGGEVELWARDPGSWGSELEGSVRLRIRAVDAPLRQARLHVAGDPDTPPSDADPEHVDAVAGRAEVLWADADPGLLPGARVRLVRRTGTVGAGDLALSELLVAVTDRSATSDGRVRVVLGAPLATEWRSPLVLTTQGEVVVDVELRHGDQVEHWRDARLDPIHPRFLLALLDRGEQVEVEGAVAEARSLPTGSRLARSRADQRDQALAPAGSLISPTTTWRLSLEDRRQEGTDASQQTARGHLFAQPGDLVDPVLLAADTAGEWVWADQPAPIGAIRQHDAACPTQPVSLVDLPDLLHVDQAAMAPARVPPTAVGTCFSPWTAGPGPEPAEDLTAWPLLDLSHQPGEVLRYQRELVDLCEAEPAGQGRIAVLALPPGLGASEVLRWRRRLASDRAALYAPWLRVAPAEAPLAALRTVPPGGIACAAVARVEARRGVHGAPANVDLRGVASLHRDGTLPDAGFLHEARVNSVRDTERGLVLLGSRTTSLDPAWTHLNVRRVVDYLERQLPLDAAWATFEPNDRVLWERLRQVVERRLRRLYDAGGLKGRSLAEGAFVRCDSSVNPPETRDAGQCVVLVGVAPSVPAEFIVFRLVLLEDGRTTVEGSHA